MVSNIYVISESNSTLPKRKEVIEFIAEQGLENGRRQDRIRIRDDDLRDILVRAELERAEELEEIHKTPESLYGKVMEYGREVKGDITRLSKICEMGLYNLVSPLFENEDKVLRKGFVLAAIAYASLC